MLHSSLSVAPWLLGAAVLAQVTAQEATSPAPGAPDEAKLLTLADAIDDALVRNDRLINAHETVTQAELSVRLERSAFRPKFTPNILGSFGQTDVTNQTYRVDVSEKLVTGTELRATVGTMTESDQLGTYYNTDTTITLSQPLLRGFGKSVTRRPLSSAEVRLADAGRARVLAEQQVAVDVATAYYRIVGQKEMVQVAQKTVERSRSLLDASTAKLEVGKVSQLDVFRARQLVAQAEAQYLDSQGAVDDAMDQLRVLLRRGPDYDFQVVSEIPVTTETIEPERAIETALATRLELSTATEALAEAERAADYDRNQLLPQFDLNLALTRRQVAQSFRSSFGLNKFDPALFFAVSMPVDRTAQTIGYHSSLIERDRRRRDIETLRRQIVEQVRRSVRQQTRLAKGLEVANASVEFAEKEVEVATLRYQRGLSNNLDVVNAEEALLGARSRRISLLADMAVARLSLRAALGTLDPRHDFHPAEAQP